MKPFISFSAIAFATFCVSACGGGKSSGPTSPATAPPAVVASPPDFSAIGAEVERFPVANVALIIGDASGELYRYEKGGFTADTQVNIASASKLMTGLAVWSLIEAGQIETGSRPADFIPFWTNDPADPRSSVTVDQLLGFTSGFNARPTLNACPGDTSQSLSDCVQSIYDDGLETNPGGAFAYGPEHMQIAALLVREATGTELSAVMKDNVWNIAGMSEATTFPNSSDNARYSGGIRSTASDYGRMLTAVLIGQLLTQRDGFLKSRTAGTETAYTIPAIPENGLDWHYGFGFWIECDLVPFAQICANDPTISSPGAFGFTPWIDFDAGYWGVLAMDEPVRSDPAPSVRSVQFVQTLQPMIGAIVD